METKLRYVPRPSRPSARCGCSPSPSAIPESPWTWIWCARCASTAAPWSAAPLPSPRGAPSKKEWQAAWLLRAITCMDLTTLPGRRHPDQCAAAVRQGEESRATRSARSARRHRHRDHGGRGVRLPRLRPARRRGAARLGDSRGPRCRRDSPRPQPLPQRIEEIKASVAAGCAGDRRGDHARARAGRRVGGAVPRGARFPGGMRQRPHEGDPRHRRPRGRS